MAVNVHYNDHNLNGITYVTIRKRKVHNLPKRSVNAIKLARRDGDRLITTEYGGKEVFIEGEIAAPSRNDMEIARDTLLAYLNTENAKLEFEQSGSLRRYYATMENIIFTEGKGGYMPFDIKFQIHDPYGYDPSATTITISGGAITATPTDKSITIEGSLPALPVITLTIGSLTGGTSADMRVTDPVSGLYISVVRTWIANDVLEIDHLNRTVKVNGTPVDFTGEFTSWAVGSGTFRYSDGFTTRSVTMTASYTKRYL